MPEVEIPTDLDFYEEAASRSPASVGFTPEGGKALLPYFLMNPEVDGEREPVTQDQIKEKVLEMMGSTSLEVGDGRIQRKLPMAHPLYESLYISAINPLQGIGKPTFQEAEPAATGTTTLPYLAVYPVYGFKLEFASRPYALIEDDQIPVVSGEYFDFDGNAVSYKYAAEWWRFTDFTIEPQSEFVTAQGGQYTFKTTVEEPSSTNPNGTPFPGMPRVFMPNSLVKFIWYQVPYRYVSSPNSFLDKWRGCINQTDWYDWKAGELLYLNFKPDRHSPPIPEVDPWFGVPSTDKLCNIELTFLSTRREGVDVPEPENPNHIAAGHNLLPWFGTRRFYYATADNGTPSFLSFPLEQLWMDPDSSSGEEE